MGTDEQGGDCMDKQAAWERFARTGRVADYLAYAGADGEEPPVPEIVDHLPGEGPYADNDHGGHPAGT